MCVTVVQIWDRATMECLQVLTGHTGSVLCLQYDERVIISGSSDATIRLDAKQWNFSQMTSTACKPVKGQLVDVNVHMLSKYCGCVGCGM